MTKLACRESQSVCLEESLQPPAVSPYFMSQDALDALPDEDRLALDAEAITAMMERGNGFLMDAVKASAKAQTRFELDLVGGFATEGILLQAAIEDGQAEVDRARAIRDERRGYSTELEEALDGWFDLRQAFAGPADALVGYLGKELGLPLADTATGTPPERVESAVTVGTIHMMAGDGLKARADLLANAEGELARMGAEAMARDFRGGQSQVEEGTQAYYARRVDRSEAGDEVKGWFARLMGARTSPYYGVQSDEDGECVLNEHGIDAMNRALEEGTAGEVREAAANLGEMKTPLGPELSRDAGRITDLLIPNPGDKVKLAVGADFMAPVGAGPSTKAGLHLAFEAEIENEGGQLKLVTKLEAAARGELDLVLAEVHGMIGAIGTIEAVGDSGREVWELVRFGVRDRLLEGPDFLQRWLGPQDDAAMARQMDDDDYVEVGIGMMGEVGGEFDTSKLPTDDGRDDAKGEGSLRAEAINLRRIQKDGDGLQRSKELGRSVTGAFKAGDQISGEGKWTGKRPKRRAPWTSHEVEVKGGGAMDVAEIEERLGPGGSVLTGFFTQIGEFMADAAGLAGPDALGKDVFLGLHQRIPRALTLDRKVLDGVQRRLDIGGVEDKAQQGFTVSFSGAWSADGGWKGRFVIELQNTFELEHDGSNVDAELSIQTSRKLVDLRF